MRRWSPVVVAVAVLAGGCASGTSGPATEEVDEETQAWNAAIDELETFCRSRARAARPAAEAAVDRLIRIARRYDEDSYVAQWDTRAALADTANAMERGRCLPGAVRRIDRALRRMPLPEPEDTEEWYPEEEEPPEPWR